MRLGSFAVAAAVQLRPGSWRDERWLSRSAASDEAANRGPGKAVGASRLIGGRSSRSRILRVDGVIDGPGLTSRLRRGPIETMGWRPVADGRDVPA